MSEMPDGGTYVWLLITMCAFVTGFFVGGRWKERALRAAGALKDTLGKL